MSESVMEKGGVRFTKSIHDLTYIREDGHSHTRQYVLYTPETGHAPMPLVFAVHYGIGEDTMEFAGYMLRGWLVAAPVTNDQINLEWMDDDLFFNNAILWEIMCLPQVDRNRILVTGGSAGGYQAMMMALLHPSLCGCCSIVGVTNCYFTALGYHASAFECNHRAIEAAVSRGEDGRTVEVPMPACQMIDQCFGLRAEKMTREKYVERSPIVYAGAFTCPILFVHFTSDNLVPIDQLTRRFTYPNVHPSVPREIHTRLCDCRLPEKVSISLEEVLPRDEVYMTYQSAPVEGSDKRIHVPFQSGKRFNIAVYDEGMLERRGGHYKNAKLGGVDTSGFVDDCMKRQAAKTAVMNAEKLVLLAEICAGVSKILPVISDQGTGSLEYLRSHVLEELAFCSSIMDSMWPALQRARHMRGDLSKAFSMMEAAIKTVYRD
jgi:Dipeptidyl aminopeptidases/acylaminoacyl-peptidases